MPSRLRVSEIFRSRTDDSTARSQLLDTINRGQKVANYSGHGSVNVWRGNLLTAADSSLFTNRDRLSLFVMMTCLNGYFHDAMNESLGESLRFHTRKGGKAVHWRWSGESTGGSPAPDDAKFPLHFLLFSKQIGIHLNTPLHTPDGDV